MASIKDRIGGLTDVEKERLVEIDFYMFVKHLLESYNHSILSTDVIESLAQLYNCNITLLKRLAHEIYNGTSPLIPSKQELVIMLYKEGLTIREIRRITGAHPQTVYRYLDVYESEGQFEYVYKSSEEDLTVIKSFMSQLKNLVNWR